MTAAKVVAIVPARGGSKGVPGKNLMPIGGVPLVGRTIAAAAGAGRVDRVLCSSDDSEILRVAAEYGALPIVRPPELSGDRASSEAALLHAVDELAGRGEEPEIVVFLQCTSPFTTSEDVDNLVAALDDPEIDCALTVIEDHSFLWRLRGGHGEGVNHDHMVQRKMRQQLEPQFRESGAGYAMRLAPFRRVGRRFCGNVGLVPTHAPPLEIDSVDDLKWAGALAAKTGRAAGPGTKLKDVAVLVTDFDGVHTEDTVYVDQDGVEQVRCSRADGYGIERLRTLGLRILILSRERNPVVVRRAEKLKVDVIHGALAKEPLLDVWLSENGFAWSQVAYIGNDANDRECLERAGISFVPADAHHSVRDLAHIRLQKAGGHGCVREVCDLILEAQH